MKKTIFILLFVMTYGYVTQAQNQKIKDFFDSYAENPEFVFMYSTNSKKAEFSIMLCYEGNTKSTAAEQCISKLKEILKAESFELTQRVRDKTADILSYKAENGEVVSIIKDGREINISWRGKKE